MPLTIAPLQRTRTTSPGSISRIRPQGIAHPVLAPLRRNHLPRSEGSRWQSGRRSARAKRIVVEPKFAVLIGGRKPAARSPVLHRYSPVSLFERQSESRVVVLSRAAADVSRPDAEESATHGDRHIREHAWRARVRRESAGRGKSVEFAHGRAGHPRTSPACTPAAEGDRFGRSPAAGWRAT